MELYNILCNINIGYIPKQLTFFKKIFFHFYLVKQRKNKQKISIIYLTNIAPSGLKYPN